MSLVTRIAGMSNVFESVQKLLEAVATEFKHKAEADPAGAANMAQELHNEAPQLAQAVVDNTDFKDNKGKADVGTTAYASPTHDKGKTSKHA